MLKMCDGNFTIAKSMKIPTSLNYLVTADLTIAYNPTITRVSDSLHKQCDTISKRLKKNTASSILYIQIKNYNKITKTQSKCQGGAISHFPKTSIAGCSVSTFYKTRVTFLLIN
jgi:hypothetical protein